MNIEQLRSAIEKALRERDSTVRVALTPVAGFVQASADTRMNGVSGGSVMDEDPERALRNLTRIHGLRVTDTGEVFDPAEAYDELRASTQREIHTLTDRLAERDAELVGMREGYAKLRETLATSERERRETQEQCDGLMSSIERIAWERDEARAILAGRTTAPTPEEMEQLRREGGRWCCTIPNGGRLYATDPDVRFFEYVGCRWDALDQNDRLRAWPVAGGAR